MKTPIRTMFDKPLFRLYKTLRSLGPVRLFFLFLFPVPFVLLMKRNDLTFGEDLLRLFIFTACTAAWWYLTEQKKSPHAQLRKPLFLESPPKKL